MPGEPDLVRWLTRQLGSERTREFLDLFGGYRVPKRSRFLVHKTRERALVALALLLVRPDCPLPNALAARVGREVGLPAGQVKLIWMSWKRKGKDALDAGASTSDATGPNALSWSAREPRCSSSR